MIDDECPECAGELIKKKRKYHVKILLGEFETEECEDCGDVYFTEKSMIEIEKKAKERGVFGWKRRKEKDLKNEKKYIEKPTIKRGEMNKTECYDPDIARRIDELKEIIKTIKESPWYRSWDGFQKENK